MIGVLEEERWPELEGIFEKDWDAALPNVGKASIIADVDGAGRIHSFMVAEHLLRIGQIHSENHYPRGIFRWLETNMPRNNTVIIIAEEPRFERICQRFDMYPMEGNVYRREF